MTMDRRHFLLPSAAAVVAPVPAIADLGPPVFCSGPPVDMLASTLPEGIEGVTYFIVKSGDSASKIHAEPRFNPDGTVTLSPMEALEPGQTYEIHAVIEPPQGLVEYTFEEWAQ